MEHRCIWFGVFGRRRIDGRVYRLSCFSTGGSRVVAVDTGYGQIDFRLRNDPRVRLIEKLNARYLKSEDVGVAIELVVMDVSFISATLVLSAVVDAAFAAGRAGKRVIVLVKPQFEAGREYVGKGGIVRDENVQKGAVERVRREIAGNRLRENRVHRIADTGCRGKSRVPASRRVVKASWAAPKQFVLSDSVQFHLCC